MAAKRARGWVLVGLMGGAIGAIAAAACGFDGAATGADDGPTADGATLDGGTGTDTPTDGGGSIEPCKTLDASCLGPLPPEWQPVSVAEDGGGCGAGYSAKTMLVDPRLAGGSCACGACTMTGALSCDVVKVTSGDGCNDSPPFATTDAGVCVTQHAQHIQAHAPSVTGAVTCTAPNDAGTGAVTDSLTLCVPGCEADFCAATSRCIVADGDQACPAGFALRARAGTGSDPGCDTCGCTVTAPTTCDGGLVAYDSDDCTTGTHDIAMEECAKISSSFDSFRVNLTPPSASCATAAISGDAGLIGVRTICCR